MQRDRKAVIGAAKKEAKKNKEATSDCGALPNNQPVENTINVPSAPHPSIVDYPAPDPCIAAPRTAPSAPVSGREVRRSGVAAEPESRAARNVGSHPNGTCDQTAKETIEPEVEHDGASVGGDGDEIQPASRILQSKRNSVRSARRTRKRKSARSSRKRSRGHDSELDGEGAIDPGLARKNRVGIPQRSRKVRKVKKTTLPGRQYAKPTKRMRENNSQESREEDGVHASESGTSSDDETEGSGIGSDSEHGFEDIDVLPRMQNSNKEKRDSRRRNH